MVNNYRAMLKDLARYLVNFAPAGAEREINRLHALLATGETTNYFALEFRPTQDTGAQLYVNLRGPDGEYGNTRVEDAEGNLWYVYTVQCSVSWASWGSDTVDVCQRRLAVMTQTVRFAADIEREFSGEFYELSQTKAQRDQREIENASRANLVAAKGLVLANVKGMKVGQSKSVACTDSLRSFAELEVERSEGGRCFKYIASFGAGMVPALNIVRTA